jgi:hypothetical protein
MTNTTPEFGKLYDELAHADTKTQSAFVAWALQNLPNRDVPAPTDGIDGSSDYGQAGKRVDYLVRCYLSREAPTASYEEGMRHVLSQPQHATLKREFAFEGRTRR